MLPLATAADPAPAPAPMLSPMPAAAARRSGCFLSFEGIDGAGKSTHLEPLAAALRAQGWAVTLTREPGGTPLGEQLRSLLLAQPMDALSEALLMFAARREHLLQVIEPALAQGQVVLCDRFSDATFAYQGHGRGFDCAVLQTLERWVQSVPTAAHGWREPDLTLWFDLSPASAAARLSGVRAPDRFEAEPLTFFERVRQGYRQRLEQAPQRIRRIDAQAAPSAVWQQVCAQCVALGLLPPAPAQP